MRLSILLKDRVVQVLLLVVILNFIALFLLWRLDLFVHVNLYDYGLEFNYDWIVDYWYNNQMGWSLLGGTVVLAILTIIPKYIYIQEHTKFSIYVGFLLSVLAISYQIFSLFFLWRVNNIVQSQLYNFGLTPSPVWISTIKDLNSAIQVLMFGGLMALLVSATKNLQIKSVNKKRTITLDQFLLKKG